MRSAFLPYCLPYIGEEEIQEVVDSLRSGWITSGPKVQRFEQDFAGYAGCRHAIAVSSCTAALHVSLAALGVGPGDEVVVPTLTFCATANVVVHLGATPVLVDVDQHGHLTAEAAERALTPRTRAILPVHYAGQACDLDALRELASRRGVALVEDAAHAAGCEYRGSKIGAQGRAVAFSFYAIKNMTTGEGGMVATDDDEFAQRVRLLALHGMSRDAWKRYAQSGSWYYEVHEPGYKYNMTDLQASLGIHQLRRLDGFLERRRRLAALYDAAFADLSELRLPADLPGRRHAYHIYPVQLRGLSIDRAQFIDELRQANIGTSVHFIPLHRQPFYQERYGYSPASFPVAEEIYAGLLSLPLYPRMTDEDAGDVIRAVREIVRNRKGIPSHVSVAG
ncbi:MAG: DegT/DnrJ/EryC1/StrS aminotransferase family protein [Acidobacteria bacterium]|nr:DegT/DnrJ/EryC1/StrS aminotransferase family protein [Acidobacteriota bacterium]